MEIRDRRTIGNGVSDTSASADHHILFPFGLECIFYHGLDLQSSHGFQHIEPEAQPPYQ